MAIQYLDAKRIRGLSYSAISLTGLKAYYNLDEASGDCINSASSIGSTDAISNFDLTVTGATQNVTGKIDKAVSFTGNNEAQADDSALTDTAFISNTGAIWTICLWVKLDNRVGDQAWLSTTGLGSGDNGIFFRMMNTAGGVYCKFGTGGGTILGGTTTTQVIPDATDWHFVVAQYDYQVGTTNVSVDNGTFEAVATSETISDTTTPYQRLMLGNSPELDNDLNGDLDEVSIWNRILTADEITKLYNAGNGEVVNKAGDSEKATLITDAIPASTGWNLTGTPTQAITGGVLDTSFTAYTSGHDGKALYDLDADSSLRIDGNFVIRFKLKLVANNNSGRCLFVLSETIPTGSLSGETTFGIDLHDSNKFRIFSSDTNQSLATSSMNNTAMTVGTQYYVQFKRDGNVLYAEMRSGSYTGTLLGSAVTLTLNGNTNLPTSVSMRYIGFRSLPSGIDWVASGADIQHDCDEMLIYDNQTGTTTLTKEFTFSDIPVSSDLPENTLFEETDTYSQWWLQDSKWIMSSPKWISNLIAWYDASDLNSITKDSSNLVSQINDKSGNDNNLTESSAKPLWVDGGQNGLDVVDFASSKVMKAEWTAKAQPITFCAVLKTPTSTGSQQNLWDNYDNTNSSMGFINRDGSDTYFQMFAPSSLNEGSGDTPYSGTWTFFVNTYDNTNSSMRINGSEKATGTVGTNSSYGLTLSNHRTGSTYGNIILGELMVFDKALSASEITDVNNYFSKKWGITIGS